MSTKLRSKLNRKLRLDIKEQLEIHSDNGIPPFALRELASAIAEELNCTKNAVERCIHPYLNGYLN